MNEAERQVRRARRWLSNSGLAVVLLLSGPAALAADPVTLLTRGDPGFRSDSGGGSSFLEGQAVVSADGRYVVFTSWAANLVPGQVDSGRRSAVFLYDRTTGARTLVSHSAGFAVTPGNGLSNAPVISADGRYVAFVSEATDLVAGQSDAPGTPDLFLYDRTTGTNVLVSHAAGAAATAGNHPSAQPAISTDGAFIAFVSTATDLIPGQSGSAYAIFLYDRAAGSLALVSHANGSATTVANGDSYTTPTLSGDGRYLAFASQATNLVPGQSGGPGNNVFLYDRLAGTSVLASHASGSAGTAANAGSGVPVLSADGSTLAFQSTATDLVAGESDGNGEVDVFVYDRGTAAVTLVSHRAGAPLLAADSWSQGPLLSADGRYVAFVSAATDLVSGMVKRDSGRDVFLYDRTAGTATLVSHQDASPTATGDDNSTDPTLSADGRYIAFTSGASDLAPGQLDSSPSLDIFLWDHVAGTTALVSTAFYPPNGAAGANTLPAISADGASVAFTSLALVLTTEIDLNRAADVFLYNRATRTNALVSARDPSLPSLSAVGDSSPAGISDDGRTVLVASDALNLLPAEGRAHLGLDLFLLDTATGAPALVSHRSGQAATTGDQPAGDGTLSADGRFVAYDSSSTDLVAGQVDGPGTPDLFLYDRTTGQNLLVSHRAGAPATAANGASEFPAISRDGGFIAFSSGATDLLPGTPAPPTGLFQIYLYDRLAGSTRLVSHHAGGSGPGDSFAGSASVSADGRFVAYYSLAANLVPGQSDTPGSSDVFLYDRLAGTSVLVSHAVDSSATAVGGLAPTVSADGRFVVFVSSAGNVVGGQSGPTFPNVFLYDRTTGQSTLVSHAAASPAQTENGGAYGIPGLSADGRFVAFTSQATDLVAGQTSTAGITNLFLWDRETGAVTLVSHAAGAPASGVGMTLFALSANGAFLAFTSRATNLVDGVSDDNGLEDLFLYDRRAGTTALLSRSFASPDRAGDGSVAGPLFPSADGAALAFGSFATDLVPGDFNAGQDAFLARTPLAGSAFFTLAPCRLLDTRTSGPLASPVVLSAHGACGIPGTAKAIAVNLTVLGGTGDGHLTAYPADVAAPLASAINFSAGRTRSNNAVLQLSLDGLGILTLAPGLPGGGTVQVILDVSGYLE